MNFSVEQYLAGFEHAVDELPGIFAGWQELDLELQGEYSDQLAWMLRSIPAALDKAAAEGRAIEAAMRVATVVSRLFVLRDGIEQLMGLTTEQIVPRSSVTDAPRLAVDEPLDEPMAA